jgi:hypothetical protein
MPSDYFKRVLFKICCVLTVVALVIAIVGTHLAVFNRDDKWDSFARLWWCLTALFAFSAFAAGI